MTHGSITDTIYNMVAEYAERLGFGKIALGDLCRTFASSRKRRLSARSDSTLPGPRIDPNYGALPGRRARLDGCAVQSLRIEVVVRIPFCQSSVHNAVPELHHQ
jgi:hypothetical protein